MAATTAEAPDVLDILACGQLGVLVGIKVVVCNRNLVMQAV